VLSTGCRPKEAAPPSSGAVPIPVSQPVRRQVTDFVDFTGQTDAVESVNIRARVTGYLETMPFQEGREVTKGATLFTIDARPYKDQLDQQESQVKVNEASLNLARKTLARDKKVNEDAPGAISQQQLDQDQAAVLEADARLNASIASTEVYKLNLEFTTVKSPIDGMVSRYYFTRGNLVIQDHLLRTARRGEFPAPGQFRLHQQRLQPFDGQRFHPREGRQPEDGAGAAAAHARHVRPRPPADRTAARCLAGDRSRLDVGPGHQVPLCAR
jgi:multidrug efflux system membrane fusion protein